MSWLSSLFSSSSTIDKATDAVVNAGDKLFYTDEEKSEMKQKYAETLPKILDSYSAFKIAQRVLAIWFSLLFGVTFLVGLYMSVLNITATKEALQKGEDLTKIALYDLAPLFQLVTAFSLSTIVGAIVIFYFGGGAIESFKRKG